MQTLTYNMTRWTTEELLDEVVRRTSCDGPALHLLETTIIRARLAESDHRVADFGTQAQVEPAPVRVGVRGTMEMGLADDAEAALLTRDGHKVDAAKSGAHTHDHTHRRRSSTKFAAHDHHHLHLDDIDADGRLNGHTHARAHAELPWERVDSR